MKCFAFVLNVVGCALWVAAALVTGAAWVPLALAAAGLFCVSWVVS